MKRLRSGLATAFSMFSILPVPKRWACWDRDGMRYALCFFPLVGVVIALFELLWHTVSLQLDISPILFGVVAALLPVLISGGIHLDGLIDTMDAIGSHAPAERKLEILHDSHVGAFGTMGCVIYLLLSVAFWSQAYTSGSHFPYIFLCFSVSRSIVSLAILRIQPSPKSIMNQLLRQGASVTATSISSCLILVIVFSFIALSNALSSLVTGILCLFYYFIHKHFVLREFGGNAGDLSGFFLLNLELLCLSVAALGGLVT